MYPATFREDMPCGRGFEWVKNGVTLKKQLMTTEKISLVSVQWIGSLENNELFINSNGERCKIKFGWNTEEVKVGAYYLDGYCEVDDKKYALEFNGCYFHGCNICGKVGRCNKVRNTYSV